MAYSAVQAASFSGGLNLRDSYEQMEADQAYDLLNVQFDNKGGVKSRPGYGAFTAAGTNRYDSMAAFSKTDGTKHLVVGAGNRLEVFNTAGSAVGSARTTGVTANPHYFCRFGGATTQAIFAANGTDTLQRWDGSSWSNSGYNPTVAGFTPDGRFLAVSPWDNRLLNARFANSVAGDNPSTVRFSDEGNPLVWGTDNWVSLTPGDGEQIMGMCAFGNYVLVFKESRYFVIYGTTSATDGTPELSYRAVEAGVGLVAPNALCVAPDGVYFLAENGVYRTDGGLPQLVSGLIDPLFTGSLPPLYGGYSINQSAIGASRMAYNNLQVYLAVPTGSSTSNDRLLMYDLRNQSWTVWDIPASAMCQFRVSGSQSDLMFAYATGANKIGRVANGYTTDDGVSISSRIKIAFNDFGDPTHKTIRESKIWGSGKVRFGVADDFGSATNTVYVDFGRGIDKWADGTDATDTWGGGTDPDDPWSNAVGTNAQLVRSSVRGAYISIDLQNSNAESPVAPWSVNKIVHHMRDRRIPSVTNLDGE